MEKKAVTEGDFFQFGKKEFAYSFFFGKPGRATWEYLPTAIP